MARGGVPVVPYRLAPERSLPWAACSKEAHHDPKTALFDVDNTLATALIDRLMHHGEALVIRGDSYRMKDKDSDPPSA
jgi:hypothetical protein